MVYGMQVITKPTLMQKNILKRMQKKTTCKAHEGHRSVPINTANPEWNSLSSNVGRHLELHLGPVRPSQRSHTLTPLALIRINIADVNVDVLCSIYYRSVCPRATEP